MIKPRKILKNLALPTHSESGFTLIEIIMVVLVFGMMYMAAPRINIFGTDINTKLSLLRSDFRSAYDMAVISNKPYRLVFHFASGDYWLEESSSEQILLGDDGIDKDPFGEEAEQKEQEFEDEFEQYIDITGREKLDDESNNETPVETPLIAAKNKLKNLRIPKWTIVETAEWGKRSLGPGLLIKGMRAWHHSEYQSLAELGADGRAAVYFLPRGYIEPAYIHIAYNDGSNNVDEKQKPYTLLVDSYAGIVDVENEETEIDFKSPDPKKY